MQPLQDFGASAGPESNENCTFRKCFEAFLQPLQHFGALAGPKPNENCTFRKRLEACLQPLQDFGASAGLKWSSVHNFCWRKRWSAVAGNEK